MRVVVQRATSASVTVDTQVVARLDSPGLLVLVGVTHGDTADVARRLARKVWELRILDDPHDPGPGRERSASDLGAPILAVSQFTLYADTRKGRRPSWSAAAPGPVSEPLVEEFVSALRELGAPVQTGVFGADMKVALVNDGPVTITMELEA
ncbi:MAG TPA: D-aminoacyl-tRNA deacylase [Propionibacteriaceae bacterium]|nr:D-aminoacyl-tRNA deacylase [Propionibacteriaceae bacterium]